MIKMKMKERLFLQLIKWLQKKCLSPYLWKEQLLRLQHLTNWCQHQLISTQHNRLPHHHTFQLLLINYLESRTLRGLYLQETFLRILLHCIEFLSIYSRILFCYYTKITRFYHLMLHHIFLFLPPMVLANLIFMYFIYCLMFAQLFNHQIFSTIIFLRLYLQSIQVHFTIVYYIIRQQQLLLKYYLQ